MNQSGLVMPANYRVFQRRRNFGTITFQAPGPLEARVLRGTEEIRPWRRYAGAIKEIPTGGPYRLEVREGGRVFEASELLVGDLWVLAGQSNMDGYGKLSDVDRPHPYVHAYYFDETWDIARDPLCRCIESIDPVHWNCPESELEHVRAIDRLWREAGAGLGVRFGKEIFKETDVPVGLLVCSHGGTSIEQWDPALKCEGGRSLYGSMLRRIAASGGRVKGVLWYQGESNSLDNTSRTYKERMRAFIEGLRADLGDSRLPFLQVQIARFFTDEATCPPEHWNRIQQAQLELGIEMKHVATIAAIDSTLDDAIHLDSKSERRLGVRLAEIALTMAYGKQAPGPLHPHSARFAKGDHAMVEVKFNNVRKALQPSKDVWGFSVEDVNGQRVHLTAESNGAVVTIRLARPLGSGARLWYGRGCNPTVNLRDAMFAAPVFGPVEIA